jgi:Yos1-like
VLDDALFGRQATLSHPPAAARARAHHTAHPPPNPTFHQAALLVVNGLAVLNNDRCLEKWGLGHSLVGRGDGLTVGPGLLRRQVVEFLHAVTYLRGKRWK